MFMRGGRKRVVAPGVGRLVETVNAYSKLYRYIDETMTDDIEEAGADVSCSRGCGACCRQIILVSVPETINLMYKFGQDSFRLNALEKLLPRIVGQVALLQKGKTVNELQDQGVTCVFLKDDESCLVHEWRPCVCRVRISFDDPGQCAIPDAEIRQLDLTSISERFSKVDKAVSRDLRISTAAMPLPVALTFARVAFKDGLYVLRDSLKWAPTSRA
jgi:Fe-S-cluster containining protein